MRPVRIVLADDHGLVRDGIRSLVEDIAGCEVCGDAGDGHEALRLVERCRPHVLLLDIGLPGLNGLEVASRVAKKHPETRIVMLSMHADEGYVRGALQSGAVGYLLKDSSATELELAIRAVVAGGKYLSPGITEHVIGGYLGGGDPPQGPVLTPRQRETLQMIAEGHSVKEIAHLLGVSVKTIESHRSQVMARLGIHDVAGLVRYAIRAGLVSSDG